MPFFDLFALIFQANMFCFLFRFAANPWIDLLCVLFGIEYFENESVRVYAKVFFIKSKQKNEKKKLGSHASNIETYEERVR